MLADNALLRAILDQLEHRAIETGVNAPAEAHETRWLAACEARAIRSVRRNLRGMASGEIKLPDDGRD